MAVKNIPLHSHELLSDYIDAATGGILHKKQVSSIADALEDSLILDIQQNQCVSQGRPHNFL